MASKNDNTMTEEAYQKSVFQDAGSLVIDMTDVEEAKNELVPKGIYDAEIDNWEFGMSESSGAPMFTGTFLFLHPDYSKTKLKSYFSFSAKALPYTKAALMKFAKDVFNAGQFDPEKIADSGVMLGRKVRVKVTHTEYEGEKRSSISNVLPAAEEGNQGNGAGKSNGFFK